MNVVARGSSASVSVSLSGSSSPSPSVSSAESDADVQHQRVHPASAPMSMGDAAAEPSARHGFACAFSQSRCGHDELFRPHYTRTNLRKGDKILRCFPHCCPDHVTRSFCGASLPLDVRWTKTPQPTLHPTEPDVLVFAKFRVQDARGPVPGDHVTLAEIAKSLQSENNPHGEWIPATRVSAAGSALASDWVFEINHEARWYYHWESGVAKRHRLKHHVLDVVVLSPSFSAVSAAAASEGDRRPLEVVAATRSPPFRLISFRRATPRAVQALSVPRVQRDNKVTSRASVKIQQRTTAPRVAERIPSTMQRRPQWEDDGAHEHKGSFAAHDARPRPLPAMRQQFQPHQPPSYYQPPQLQSPHRYPPSRPPPPRQPQPPQHYQQQQPSPTPSWGAPPSFARQASRPSIADLALSIDRLATAATHQSPALGPLPQKPVATAAQRLLRLLRCLDRVSAAETVVFMDTFQRVYADAVARASGVQLDVSSSSSPSPVDAVRRLLTDARVASPTQASLSRDATAILCELLLWLSFDVELHRAIHAAVARDAASLFSRRQLETAFDGFVEWLARHVDAFLRDRGWRVDDVLRAVDPRGECDDRALGSDACAAGLRACVAMLSEFNATQATAARRRLGLGLASIKRPLPAVRSTSTGSTTPSQWAINGQWTCDLLQGGLAVQPSSAVSSNETLSLRSLFAMLRELGTVSIRVDDARTMDVVSLLNASGRHDHHTGTRLALDGASHWFRQFPSGLATAALSSGGLQWGDHSGEIAAASQAVHCNLYAWTAASHASQAHSLGRCVQLQLWTPAPDVLRVRVAVSRAAPDARVVQSLDAAVQQLPFCSLQQKLRLVRAWEPTLQAELQYTRISAGRR